MMFKKCSKKLKSHPKILHPTNTDRLLNVPDTGGMAYNTIAKVPGLMKLAVISFTMLNPWPFLPIPLFLNQIIITDFLEPQDLFQ